MTAVATIPTGCEAKQLKGLLMIPVSSHVYAQNEENRSCIEQLFLGKFPSIFSLVIFSLGYLKPFTANYLTDVSVKKTWYLMQKIIAKALEWRQLTFTGIHVFTQTQLHLKMIGKLLVQIPNKDFKYWPFMMSDL